MPDFNLDEIRQRWGRAEATKNLLHLADYEERHGASLTGLFLRWAVEMSERYLSLTEAVWPGKPKWEPTEAQPQQDFFEAFAESLWSQQRELAAAPKLLMALKRLTATVRSRFERLEIVGLVPQDLANDVAQAEIEIAKAERRDA